MNDYNFGNFLCMLRENKGMTQADLANILGVTPAAVSKWENGSSKPRVEVLFQLAQVLDVSAEELMSGHYIETGKLEPEAIKKINERYEYLRKVDSYNTAGVKIRRLLAWIIDWNIIGFFVWGILSVYRAFLDDTRYADSPLPILGMLFIMLLYPFCFILRDVIFGGRSIGKKITKLVVLDKKTGLSAKPGKRILRNLFLPIMQIDVIIMLASGTTIGDRVAHTVVVPHKILQTDVCDMSKDDVSKINNYSAPKPTNIKKVVLIIISAVVLFFVFVSSVTLFALSKTKDTEEYEIAYNYLVESDSFKALDVNESKIRMNRYSSHTYSSQEGTSVTQTVEIGFIVNFKSFEVVCHKEKGYWEVCEECTKFN